MTLNARDNRFYREPETLDSTMQRLVVELDAACQKYLRQAGLPTSAGTLMKAAKAVVWWRYYGGDDGWDKLKAAIGQLEGIVGRPKSEQEIY